jgi:hypothetical protein
LFVPLHVRDFVFSPAFFGPLDDDRAEEDLLAAFPCPLAEDAWQLRGVEDETTDLAVAVFVAAAPILSSFHLKFCVEYQRETLVLLE